MTQPNHVTFPKVNVASPEFFVQSVAFVSLGVSFHGENDPVARKIFRIADEKMTLQPPEDKDITSLYLGGVRHFAIRLHFENYTTK